MSRSYNEQKRLSNENTALRQVVFELDSKLSGSRRRSSLLWVVVNAFSACVGYLKGIYTFLAKRKYRITFNTIKNRYSSNRELKQFVHDCQSLSLKADAFKKRDQDVDVSIIIPVYNQWRLTCACLHSIIETCGDSINYEIILANDCSTDETVFAADHYPGIRVVNTPKNVGFLKNCNHAVRVANGRYIMLVNNDTIVLRNWLASLFNTMEEDHTAAIVGSKILSPNGKILEAGVILFRDGSDIHIGKGAPRDSFLFNFQRETDCVSGCSIMIRKSFWDSVQGFDERYHNAYFEDYDLAMTARANNMRVIYQPKSEIIHFEHKTYSSRSKNRHILLSNHNKRIFLEKWADHLMAYHHAQVPWHIAMSFGERQSSLIAKKRKSSGHLNILFYSPDPLFPSNHGNRVRMINLIRHFKEMGHVVHFAVLDRAECTDKNVKGMQDLLQGTVDLIPTKRLRFSPGAVPYDGWYEKGIGEHVRYLCGLYDIDVVLCSYVFQSKLFEYVPNHILKVLDTHDIMADRTTMLSLNNIPIGQFSCTPGEEGAYLRRADIVIGITPEETKYFDVVAGYKISVTISHIEKPQFLRKKFSSLKHVGVVASNNRFNLAMIKRLLDSICEHFEEDNQIPFVIHIIGDVKKGMRARSWLSDKNRLFKKNWLCFHGFVPNIAEAYAKMDLIVSPMMCGTGLNIKTIEAMAFGMPLLSTSHASRGIETAEPMHQFETINALVEGLLLLSKKPFELDRLANLSRDLFLNFQQKNENALNGLFSHPKIDQLG